MTDENGKTGQDLNIDEAARGGSSTSTQTREGGGGSGGGNSQSDQGGGSGTGNDGGGTSSGADALTPDAEGKFEHPETKAKISAVDLATYYRDKFGASTKGAQDLLDQNKTLTGERDTSTGKIAALEADIVKFRELAEGKNPDGLKVADIQAQLAKTSEELALVKEGAALDAFEKSVPLATGNVRESLKALARANPKESLQTLYDNNLKAGAEATDTKRKADEEARKKGASDQGKGTSTREPAGGGITVAGRKGDTGLSLEEFNALPVAQRKNLIDKYGIA